MIKILKQSSIVMFFLSVSAYSANHNLTDMSCGYMEDEGQLDLSFQDLSLRDRFKRDLSDENLLNKNLSRATCKIAVSRIDQVKNATYVDIRESREFDEDHIPGSINLDFHLVETRNFLKKNPVILVDSGFHYAELFQYCDSFQKKGFTEVYVLDGGFPAWYERHESLFSKSKVHSKINYIQPVEFDSLKRKSNWLVFDFSTPFSKVSGRYYQLPLQDKEKDVFEKTRAIIEKFASKTGRAPNILIVDSDGSKISSIFSLLPGRFSNYAYTFLGGIAEYEKYTQMNHKVLVGKVVANKKRNTGCNR